MVKVDLKDAYFIVPIHKEHRALLKFQFQEETYQFQCLPFGLACAPWAFTKVSKPVIALLRQLGVRLVCYIDDVLMAETLQLARDHGQALVFLLENLGFIISHTKCVLEPTQRMEFLGFVVSSTDLQLSLPSTKVKKIRAEAKSLAGREQVTVRQLSQFLGKLTAATTAIPLAQLFYGDAQRAMNRALETSGQDYSAILPISAEVKAELQLWSEHLSL